MAVPGVGSRPCCVLITSGRRSPRGCEFYCLWGWKGRFPRSSIVLLYTLILIRYWSYLTDHSIPFPQPLVLNSKRHRTMYLSVIVTMFPMFSLNLPAMASRAHRSDDLPWCSFASSVHRHDLTRPRCGDITALGPSVFSTCSLHLYFSPRLFPTLPTPKSSPLSFVDGENSRLRRWFTGVR